MKLVAGNQQSPAGSRHRRLSRNAAHPMSCPAVRGHGNLCRGAGERPGRGYLRHPIDVLSGQRQPDGTVDPDRRAEAGLRAAHHGGDPLFRLRAPGSQDAAAHADLGQARSQYDHPRRRRPRADRRSACRPNPGLLRHPDRQPLCRAGDGARHPLRFTNGNTTVVSPDVGGVVRARSLASRIDVRHSPSSTSAASSRANPRS